MLPIRVFLAVQILGAVLAFWFVPVRSLIGFMGTLLCRPCFANPVWRTLFGFWRSIMFYFVSMFFFLKGTGWGIREVLSLFFLCFFYVFDFYVFLCFSMFSIFSMFFFLFFYAFLCFSMFFYVFLCFWSS